MKNSKLLLLLLTAAAAVAGDSARGTQMLSAQVVRCWDVVCTVDTAGTMRCMETPKPCPQEVT